MSNEKIRLPSNPLKTGFCEFCDFVRGHVGETSPHAYGQADRLPPLHNNKNNKIIYINRIDGVPSRAGVIA